MYVNKKQVPTVNDVYGIGGRDTKSNEMIEAYLAKKEQTEERSR